MGKIKAVLFDADGVLQRPTVPWRPAFKVLFGIDGTELDRFAFDVSALETRFLDTEDDFPTAMRGLLASRSWDDRLDDALSVLNAIEVNQEIIEVVRRLRRAGMGCYLATNQQSHLLFICPDNSNMGIFSTRNFTLAA